MRSRSLTVCVLLACAAATACSSSSTPTGAPPAHDATTTDASGLRNADDVPAKGTVTGTFGTPAKLGSTIMILVRGVTVGQPAQFDRPVLIVDARAENRSPEEEAYVNLVTRCGKVDPPGYYLAGSKWGGVDSIPPKAFSDGKIYMLAPGQTGSATQFTPCAGTVLSVERSGGYMTDDTPLVIQYPLPDQLLKDLAAAQH